MPSFEEIHSRDVSGKTYSRQSPGVLQEAPMMINSGKDKVSQEKKTIKRPLRTFYGSQVISWGANDKLSPCGSITCHFSGIFQRKIRFLRNFRNHIMSLFRFLEG